MTTAIDVRNRVMDLCERIQLPAPAGVSHVYRTEGECSFADADLPAFVVKVSPRPHEYNYTLNANTTYTETFEVLIGMYVSHICDESYGVNMDAQDSAELAAATVIAYFAARPTLSMNYDGGIVGDAHILRSFGPHTMDTNTSNRGVQFRMTVTLRNTVDFDDE